MTQLAHEACCSVRELESALEQMKHMGYIRNEQFGQSCSSSCSIDRGSSHCDGCGFASSETLTFWVLTEKGQTFVDTEPK